MVERSKAVRWKPEDGRPQTGVPAAPTFRPTTEEFKDPVAYIDSIRPQAEKCARAGLAIMPCAESVSRAACGQPHSLQACDCVLVLGLMGTLSRK